MRSSFKQIITASYNGKEAKKGAQNNTDYSQVVQLTQKRRKLHLKKIKVYTNLTSNHHPENLMLNAVI